MIIHKPTLTWSHIPSGLLALTVFLAACSAPRAIAEEMAVLSNILLATNVATAISDETDPGRPGAGFDGTNYLVVTARSSVTPGELLGIVVSPKGNILHQFPIGGDVARFPDPALAFDGINYLLVYNRQGQIFGLRISPAGQLLDLNDGFPISTGVPYQISNYRPGVAFDGQNFLVVWQKYQDPNYAIYGARVTPGGQVLGEFLIFAAALWQTSPQVAFDGANYLVVWENEHGVWPDVDLDIYGTRVSPAGTVLDPAGIPISSAAKDQQSPHLAFDGRNYLVVWLDGRNHSADRYISDIFAARVSTNGVVLDGPPSTGGIPINTSPVEYKNDPRVCFDGQDFFVVWWLATYSPPAGSFAARVSTDGLLLDGSAEKLGIQIRTPDPFCRVVHPNPVSNGRSILVPWINNAELGGTSKDAVANLIVAQPRITTINPGSPGPQDVTITFTSRLQMPYLIQSSGNLTAWQLLGSPVARSGQPLDVVLHGEAAAPLRFFRVQPDY